MDLNQSMKGDLTYEKILVETDSPYLTPEPVRGKRNEPKNVKFVIEKIAQELEISTDDLKNITTINAKKFYNLG